MMHFYQIPLVAVFSMQAELSGHGKIKLEHGQSQNFGLGHGFGILKIQRKIMPDTYNMVHTVWFVLYGSYQLISCDGNLTGCPGFA